MSVANMLLESNTIKALATWQPIEEVSPREVVATLELRFAQAFGPEQVHIAQLENSESGLSSYDLYFVTPVERRFGNTEGVAIYLSSFIRVAALGMMSGYFSPQGCSYAGIRPEDVATSSEHDALLLRTSINAVRESNYHLLTKDEALSRLPSGVVPYEYCFGPEPWDRVFHVLYSNTD